MKIGGADEPIIIVSQTNNGPIRITASVLASGIIGYVVSLYLNHALGISSLSVKGDDVSVSIVASFFL